MVYTFLCKPNLSRLYVYLQRWSAVGAAKGGRRGNLELGGIETVFGEHTQEPDTKSHDARCHIALQAGTLVPACSIRAVGSCAHTFIMGPNEAV